MADSLRPGGAGVQAPGGGDSAPNEPDFGGQELAELLHATHEAVIVLEGEEGRVVSVGGASSPEILQGVRGRALAELVDAGSADTVRHALSTCNGSTRSVRIAFSMTVAGRLRFFDGALRRLDDQRTICVARDVTAHRAADSALTARYGIERLLGQFSSRFINILPEHIDDAINTALAELGRYSDVDRVYLFSLQPDTRTMMNSHQWTRSPRLPSAQGTRLSVQELPWIMSKLQAHKVVCMDRLNDLPESASAERRLLLGQGVGSMVAIPIIYSGGLRGFVGFDLIRRERLWSSEQIHLLRTAGEIFASALQRRQSEERIYRLAYYDGVTGLPNRLLLRRRLQERLSEHPDQPFALVLIDMDDAGMLNDLLGHDVGDVLLRVLGGRLAKRLRDTRTLARWGADEFMFSLPLTARGDELNAWVTRIRKVLTAPVQVAGQSLQVSFSTGVVRYPDDALDVGSLVRYAELALRQARQSGRGGLQYYQPALQANAVARNRMQQRLRQAVETGAFRLHYQPLLSAATGKLAGAEALIRWHDSELGEVPPDRFISVAEETGLIVPMGDWVLRKSCTDLARWRESGLFVPRVSVNVSGHQLLDDRLPQTLEALLKTHQLPATAVELEITESTLMEREKRSLPVLQRLREIGIGMAVDDFGTGYSSLGKLKHLPVNVLKIDRSFIQDIFTDENDRAIVIAVLAMARQLKLQVVAEGVETPEQLSFLRKHGCDMVQGHIHSPPLPFAAFRRWVEMRQRRG
ncbi:MAG: sensor domain-containing phosphodiesterase [Aquisalimonadaceae bacterium]